MARNAGPASSSRDRAVPRRPSAADVARAANVSVSAVSRTFTKGASVSDKTRERVLSAASALGYRPNALARAMFTHKSRLIAVVMTNYRSPNFPQLLKCFNDELEARGFSMLLLLAAGREDADEALERARDYRVDGIVLAAITPSSESVAALDAEGIPVVVLDRAKAAPTLSQVWIDGQAVGRQVAERLLSEGRRHAVAISHANLSAEPAEIASFTACIEEAGFSVRRLTSGADYADGLAAGAQLFGQASRPDAIFATGSMFACGLYDAAMEHGIRVPDDLAIVAVGNAQQLSWRSHPISAVAIPVEALAREAVQIMAERIGAPALAPVRRFLPCDIVWRRTTLAHENSFEP